MVRIYFEWSLQTRRLTIPQQNVKRAAWQDSEVLGMFTGIYFVASGH